MSRSIRSIAAFLSFVAGSTVAQAQPQTVFAITHVNVVDVEAGTTRADQTVIVDGNRIRAVGSAASTAVPRGARIIDGRGGWLIPGLWDLHVHLAMAGRSSLGMLVANGVTGVREMGGQFDLVRGWRDSVRSGSLIGPRIEMVGPIVESAQWLTAVKRIFTERGDTSVVRQMNERIGVGTPDEARAAVERLAALGVSMIKVRTDPPGAAYFTLLREAKGRGLRVVGHSPDPRPSIAEASDSGLASIEHQLLTFDNGGWSATLDGLTPPARAELFEKLKRNGTALDPTLIASVGFRRMPDSLVRAIIADSTGAREPRRRYITAALAWHWKSQMDMKAIEGAQPDWNALALQSSPHLRALDSAGVLLLAGTDLGTPLTYPGSGLHDELGLLVREGGLSPARALRMATVAPAQFFGVGATRGRIAAGAEADLVLLTGNPLADIANVGRIRAVVLAGRLLDRAALDQLMESAARDR